MEQDICGCYRTAPSAAPPSPLREAACDEEALLDLPACEWMIRDRNGTSLIKMCIRDRPLEAGLGVEPGGTLGEGNQGKPAPAGAH